MNSVRRFISIACVGVGLLAVCDCKRARKSNESKEGTTTVTSAELRHSVEVAGARLATARCERETSCAHLTSWTRAANYETCLGVVKSEVSKELSPEVCPRGIEQNQLADCIAAIERTSCVDPVGLLMELEDCRRSKLCVGLNAP